MDKLNEEKIRNVISEQITKFCNDFYKRHIGDLDNPNGTINSKIHNIFIAELGSEVQYYSAMTRSFDSAFGNLLERLAIEIANINYVVKNRVEGPLSKKQTEKIAYLLEEYKRHTRKPLVADYKDLRETVFDELESSKRHESDYYLIDKDNNSHHLIELKIGGDLDNKKARSEKEALLEQYAILSNVLPENSDIKIHFGTAYNRFGEANEWKQGRVLQFFAPDELLIGKDFWNFVCKSNQGYNIVRDQYNAESYRLKNTLENIKKEYLNQGGE